MPPTLYLPVPRALRVVSLSFSVLSAAGAVTAWMAAPTPALAMIAFCTLLARDAELERTSLP